MNIHENPSLNGESNRPTKVNEKNGRPGCRCFLSAEFAAVSKNSGKNLCCLLKIDITSVIDATENEHTSRRYTVVFCFGDEIHDASFTN